MVRTDSKSTGTWNPAAQIGLVWQYSIGPCMLSQANCHVIVTVMVPWVRPNIGFGANTGVVMVWLANVDVFTYVRFIASRRLSTRRDPFQGKKGIERRRNLNRETRGNIHSRNTR